MLELVHAPKQARSGAPLSPAEPTPTSTYPEEVHDDPYVSSRIEYRLAKSDSELRDLFEAVRQYLVGLGDDVQVKELKNYIAFKRLKNFTCAEIYPQVRVVTLYLRIDPTTVELEDGFSRDVTKIGHFGTGNLELSLKTMEDLVKAQPLLQRAYEGS